MGVCNDTLVSIDSSACLTGALIAGALIEAADGTYRHAQLFRGTSEPLGSTLILAA